MEMFNHTRRTRQRKRSKKSGFEKVPNTESAKPAAEEDEDEDEDLLDVVVYKSKEQITLIDGDGDSLGHGYIEDVEPDLSGLDVDLVPAEVRVPMHWLLIKLTAVVCNTVALQLDCVFDQDGSSLCKGDRKLVELQKRPDGFIVYHQHVTRRKRSSISDSGSQSKKHKRTSTPGGGVSKVKHQKNAHPKRK